MRACARKPNGLHTTLSTVETHVGALIHELGVLNCVEVALWANETSP